MKLPIILYENKNTQEDLGKLKKNEKIWKIIDIYEKQLSELFEITHPSLKLDSNYETQLIQFIKQKQKKSLKLQGNWIYFPWNGNLIHTVNEEEYKLLLTNRNRNLIFQQEQRSLFDISVGIIGLSLGSSIASGLAHQGIANRMKLAENDRLETTNLNRVHAKIDQVGIKKIDITAQQVYEINPYAQLDLYSEGLTKENIKNFVHEGSKPRVIFEIIDDFEMKIILRIEARKAGIPVIMFSNLGDSILVDIERYDLNPSQALFNGVLGDLPEKILENPDEDKNKYAVAMVGIENVPMRAMESVREINKTLTGRPQLASTIDVASGLAGYLLRQITLGDTYITGRKKIVFDKFFQEEPNSE